MTKEITRSAFELSFETKLIIERLSEMQFDDVITYEQLSDIIGRNICTCRWILKTAINRVARDYGIVIDTVRRVGVKRSNDPTIATAGERVKHAMRRQLKRAGDKVRLANDANLTSEQRREKYSFMTLTGTVQYFLRPAVTKAVKAEIEDHQTLSVGTVLDLVKKAG